jgi:hypothetical protein
MKHRRCGRLRALARPSQDLFLRVGDPRNDRVDRPPPVPAPPAPAPVLPLAARVSGRPCDRASAFGAGRRPQRSAESGSHALDGLGEHGLARTKFSRTKLLPGEPNRSPGSSATRPRSRTHCAVACHFRYGGSPATQGRPPAVAAGEHRVAARRSGRQLARRIVRVSSGASGQGWPVVRAADVARGTANRHGDQLASGRAPGAGCGRY